MTLAFGACVAAMVTWFHVAFGLLDIADEPPFCQRHRSRWLLVVLAAAAAGVMIFMMVLGCVSVYTEMSRDSDRPITCTNDELGGCMPTVDRSDPAIPQTVHAIYVAAAIALVGLAALLVCSRLRARTPTRAGWETSSPHTTTEHAPTERRRAVLHQHVSITTTTGIHRMVNDNALTLGPPHPGSVDPDHFTAGDSVVFGCSSILDTADTRTSIVVSGVATDAGCIALRGAHIAGGDVYQTSIGNVLHADGCDACAQCAAARQRADAQQNDDQRSDFTPEGLARAEALCERGLTALSSAGLRCGHGNTYALAADAPLPPWMHTALAGVVFTAPEGPWPNWARTDAPIDWPELIAAHPEVLAADPAYDDDLCAASWTSIVEAFTLARRADPHAALDVCLWVDTDGTVLVDAAYLFTSHAMPAPTATAISDTLAAGGRPRDVHHLSDGDEARIWMLNN